MWGSTRVHLFDTITTKTLFLEGVAIGRFVGVLYRYFGMYENFLLSDNSDCLWLNHAAYAITHGLRRLDSRVVFTSRWKVTRSS